MRICRKINKQALTEQIQSGSSLPRVAASDILSVKLPIPNLDRQREIGGEIEKRRSEIRHLQLEAEAIVTVAKARVERMILVEEVGSKADK